MTDSRRDDVGKQDEYRANAAECQRMAGLTRNQAEQQTWLEMAASWLRMDAYHRNSGANTGDNPVFAYRRRSFQTSFAGLLSGAILQKSRT